MGPSCRTLLWGTLVGSSCGAVFWDTFDTTNHPAHQRHAAFTPACFALPSGTASRKHTSHQGRAFLQKSRVQSPKRAFRARLPPTVTRQVSKTSISYETSSKTHMSKSARRGFRTRLPPKVKRKHPSEHAHHAALPSSFAIPAPPDNTRPHANPNVTATFTSTTTHNLTIPCACHSRLTRTKHCACHEMSPPSHLATSRFPALATKIALPATKSENIISCELQQICTTPHVWNDFDPS